MRSAFAKIRFNGKKTRMQKSAPCFYDQTVIRAISSHDLTKSEYTYVAFQTD